MSTRTTSRLSKWVLGSPLIVFALIFVVYPVYQGIQTGFYSLSLQNPDTLFAGLENFGTVLTDPGFLAAAKFTLLFALAVTAIETVLGFGLALLVNREFPGKKVFFTMLLVPIMVAPALLGVMFRLLLNGDIGLVPEVLRGVGLDVSLFASNTVVPLLVLLDVLQWTPFAFLIMYAGLQSFPSDVLEAAQVDGAGRLRTLRSIVVPMMKPIIFAAAASTIVMVVLIPFVPLFVKRIATPGAAE
ncbi:carbohydrate ABC transporter permease [Kribbella solani]|uniref:carbohydrate ABC transporter permease n=1 Tax=Kribbella solani TaxID=236067 RepID=UPI0029B8EEE1|nr:sugar ABC transporter permease [Kribbella solani]MDX2969710.1 sugar ABC transporter permease [Kribbella solani]